MEEKISVRICTETIASCGECYTRKHDPVFAGAIYEIRVGNVVNRLCKDCLKKLAKDILEVL